jgi:hypothetical protein
VSLLTGSKSRLARLCFSLTTPFCGSINTTAASVPWISSFAAPTVFRSRRLLQRGGVDRQLSQVLAGCRENRVGHCGNDGRSPGTVLATVVRRRASPRPGWLVHAGGEAGVDFFGIERCDGFGCGKGYGRAVLVADPRHAARRRLRTVNDVTQAIRKAGEALAPATAFPRPGTVDRHCRGHTRNERDAGRDIGDPDADRHALR